MRSVSLMRYTFEGIVIRRHADFSPALRGTSAIPTDTVYPCV